MKRIFSLGLSLALLLTLIAVPVMVAAQDDTELELFESEDGLFSVMLPEGWVAEQNDDAGGFVIASSEDLIPLLAEDDVPELESDQVVIVLLPLPAEFLFFFGVEDAEAPLEELAASVAQGFIEDEDIEVEVEILEFDEISIARVAVPPEALEIEEDEAEAALYIVQQDGALIIGVVVTGIGGLEEYGDLIAEVIASFDIDIEAFFAAEMSFDDDFEPAATEEP